MPTDYTKEQNQHFEQMEEELRQYNNSLRDRKRGKPPLPLPNYTKSQIMELRIWQADRMKRLAIKRGILQQEK